MSEADAEGLAGYYEAELGDLEMPPDLDPNDGVVSDGELVTLRQIADVVAGEDAKLTYLQPGCRTWAPW
jgi:hypothetical protein